MISPVSNNIPVLSLDELMKIPDTKNNVLNRISLESIWYLLEQCQIKMLNTDELLIKKGQTGQPMYLLLAGELSVHLNQENDDPIAVLKPGEAVGELSIIDASPATAFVKAAQESRLLAIDEEIFWNLVATSHDFCTNLLMLLAHRMRANNSKITESQILHKQLEKEAIIDALTGLRNRRWLDANLSRLAQRHMFDRSPLSILMLDIDFFKRFNDRLGHAAGDTVLSKVAKVVMAKLRPTDVAARYGGEEFLVILPYTTLEGAYIAAQRLRDTVSKTPILSDDDQPLPPVTISIGVACLNPDETVAHFQKRADKALYKAKENGRNRVEHAQ